MCEAFVSPPTIEEPEMGDAPLLTPEEPVLRIGTPSTPTLTPFKECAIKLSATDPQNNCLESGRCDTDGRLSEICDTLEASSIRSSVKMEDRARVSESENAESQRGCEVYIKEELDPEMEINAAEYVNVSIKPEVEENFEPDSPSAPPSYKQEHE
uniref:Uncharacterized protein n=1 Tax=Timema bartmani TaxID=61472 RepID=A0A7R9FC05_9NEOP|nr:unnamed protein product [Timema bartmani]